VTLVRPLSNGNCRPILSVAPAFCNNDAELAILGGSRARFFALRMFRRISKLAARNPLNSIYTAWRLAKIVKLKR